jgi:hypothetical protein
MKKSNPGFRLQIAMPVVAMLALLAQAQAEPVVPPAKSIKAEETAILLVDFQANFVSPDGAWYQKFAQHYAKTRMLERTRATRRTIASSILRIPAAFTAGRSAAVPGRSAPRKPRIMSR